MLAWMTLKHFLCSQFAQNATDFFIYICMWVYLQYFSLSDLIELFTEIFHLVHPLTTKRDRMHFHDKKGFQLIYQMSVIESEIKSEFIWRIQMLFCCRKSIYKNWKISCMPAKRFFLCYNHFRSHSKHEWMTICVFFYFFHLPAWTLTAVFLVCSFVNIVDWHLKILFMCRTINELMFNHVPFAFYVLFSFYFNCTFHLIFLVLHLTSFLNWLLEFLRSLQLCMTQLCILAICWFRCRNRIYDFCTKIYYQCANNLCAQNEKMKKKNTKLRTEFDDF